MEQGFKFSLFLSFHLDGSEELTSRYPEVGVVLRAREKMPRIK